MKRGLTLVEILLAIFLLFLTTLFVMQMFTYSLRYSQRSKEQVTVALLAQSQLESVLTLFNPATTNTHGNFSEAFVQYEYNVEVSNDEGHLKFVRVTVKSPQGASASLSALR